MAVPVWQSGLTKLQSHKIERVQRAALAIILGTNEYSYTKILHKMNLKTLADRRENMCLKFIKKNVDSEVPLLSRSQKVYKTRDKSKIVNEFQCRTNKYYNSALPYLARLLNSNNTQS